MAGALEIWDVHTHLSGVPGDTPEARLGKMLEFADRMGVARLCVFMGMQWSHDPSPEKLRQDNDDVLRAVSQFRTAHSDSFISIQGIRRQASTNSTVVCGTGQWWP
jgi:hypothetical protein